MLFRFHTVLPAGVAAIALGLLGPAALADDYDETTTEPAAAEAKPTQPSTFTPPRQLDTLSKEELLVMVKDLTLRNQILTQRLAEQREDLASAEPELQARIGFQARTISRLTEELERAEAQLAAAPAATPAPQQVQPQAPSPEGQPVDPHYDVPGAGGTTNDPDAATDAEKPAWEFRVAYAFGLLGSVNGGRVTLFDENGPRPRNEYDPNEYRSDAMWVQVTLRNDSDQPTGFTGQIQLQGDASVRNGGQRPVLAEESFTTPILQPGQIFQISNNTYAIEQPWRVSAVQLVEVQGITPTTPPNLDPI